MALGVLMIAAMYIDLLLFFHTVTVRSLDGMTFRGFLLQGRLMSDDTTVVGTFTVTDDTNSRLSSCQPAGVSELKSSYKL